MVLAKEKRGHFLYCLFCPKEIFFKFVSTLNVKCIEYTFRIYILLLIKKHYFIHFCCLFLKSSKAFSVSLKWNLWNFWPWIFEHLFHPNINVIKLPISSFTFCFFLCCKYTKYFDFSQNIWLYRIFHYV